MNRQPNGPLRELIRESGLSYEEVAREVRAVAAESGDSTIHTSKSNVAYWVRGTPPRAQTAQYLREALARRLGRSVSSGDIGLTVLDDDSAPVDLGLTVEGDPVETLRRLGRADIERRSFLTTAAYSVAAAALPLGAADDAHARTRRALRGGVAGEQEIRAVQDMVAMFTAIDERHGGQHGRSAVVQYLTSDVAGLCRARFRTARQHDDMLSVAASLAYLAGWKAYDAGETGLAQRYYLQAYALTTEAGDLPHQAFNLRILAHHGMLSGRPDHVLQLADAALARARGRVDPVTESVFVICRARALAAEGRYGTALAEADRARALAERPGTADAMTGWASMWGAASATVASHTAKLHERVGDHPRAERHYARARQRYGGTEHRRIASLSAAAEGHAQCRQGRIEAACATWGQALDGMAGIRSARTVKAVGAMRSALAPLAARGARPARELDERARLWLRAST
ncbi:hypothetical protein [Streptomyces yaizuensis]|uniref:Twin-arginine translocation signal domain-containing protein n=1 Tax=Streptomyces yaizuensis TaxID=2989713 RepID=A0ABQ5P9G0_9ACTN|nr:hypothetical protein [Streptomyces sp. YSPA8]GLF99125.1 twin-arginine translocation signal domain-containing protein [Streptomyces sp. YSPA8]